MALIHNFTQIKMSKMHKVLTPATKATLGFFPLTASLALIW